MISTNNPPLLEYDLPFAIQAKGIHAFMTQRNLTIGYNKNTTFNTSYFCGDKVENVNRNLEILCNKIGINRNFLFISQQIHEDKILKVDHNFINSSPTNICGFDAIITNLKGVCIGIHTADCVPLIFIDTQSNTLGVAHAGWKGTIKRIGALTIKQMQSFYGCLPKNIICIIGPAISQKQYEVNKDVADTFRKIGYDAPPYVINKKNIDDLEKSYLDLQLINKDMLLNVGLTSEHIYIDRKCTYTNNEVFFSARRDGFSCGRMLTGVYQK